MKSHNYVISINDFPSSVLLRELVTFPQTVFAWCLFLVINKNHVNRLSIKQ